MERNWYVVCTKQKKERKVAAALNKGGIENFCPFTIIERMNVSRSSKEYCPLFSSYVFVKMMPSELKKLQHIAFVVNPLYWKSEPAIINADEINAIKMMCENYSAIRLEKTSVKENGKISVVEKNITGYNNHSVTIQHQGISVSLPTLGYSLSAEREKKKEENPVVEKKGAGKSLTQRFNLLAMLGIHL
jgi:transcription antitermination factor NusG